MLLQGRRAGRGTVARLFTLVLLLGTSGACVVPMSPPALTATAASGGGQMTPVVITNPTLASSLLADVPPSAPGASAVSTPSPNATPVATPTPSASATPVPPTTPAATATPVAGTPRPATPGASTPAAAKAVTPGATGTVVVVQAASASGDMGAQTVTLLNTYRAQAGLPALKVNAALTASANNYARLLADRNAFGHDGPDGSSPQSRIAASGYAGRFKGEALAAGQTTPQSAINTWLNSPAHRDIVMDRSAVDVGIGYYSKPGTTYTTYWVLVTGS